MISTRPDAVLFDWDNTLVDSWPTLTDAMNHMLRAMGRPAWTPDEVRAQVRHSVRDALPVLFGDRWEEARSLYLGRYRAIHLDRLTEIDGSERALRRLFNHGVPMAVVSNKTGALLRREAEALGWTGFFQALVGAGDAIRDKPDAAPIDLALEACGGSRPAVWYVGDTSLDLECARNAGCIGVLLETAVAGIHAEPLAVREMPRHRFADLPALADAALGNRRIGEW